MINQTRERRILSGKEILITGGTGTLGKALLKELSGYPLKGLRILSRDEFKQWKMKSEMKAELEKAGFPVAFFIGDVRDNKRLLQAFEGVDIVIHTAAMKQVPACEDNPFESIRTNILGTENVCAAAIEREVKHVMFISTDKAVYPINLYGSCKSVAEKTVIRSNVYSPHVTKFNVCRYGNVLGSRGSVVQLFQEQLEKGLPLTITSKEMTRFWITSKFMASFIIKSICEDTKGVIFVPFMKSASLMQLMGVVQKNHTRKEDSFLEIKEIGIRKGEKLHECLITEEEMETLKMNDFAFMLPDAELSEIRRKFISPLFKEPFTSNHPEVLTLTDDELEAMINE